MSYSSPPESQTRFRWSLLRQNDKNEKKGEVLLNNRERVKAILHYEDYDRLPLVYFGFWGQTLQKWREEGHLTANEINGVADSNPQELQIAKKLGFDFNWQNMFGGNTDIIPTFEAKVIEERADGFKKVMDGHGVITLQRKGAGSIPAEVDHLLKGREEWEEYFKPRLKFSEKRINKQRCLLLREDSLRENPLGLHCGSLFGKIRNWIGVVNLSYLYVDDEVLYDEIIATVGELSYDVVKDILETGAKFDFAHFWEDICFKNGPLINPKVFKEKVGPYYKKITKLLNSKGIDIISLDCDGCIDSLVPIWLDNGVNTMFPIEVGTWNGNIAKWRKTYGKSVLGVGGMDKKLFAKDYDAVDAEIERLKPLVELGGFIPCPDHRIPPDAKWENIQYYCEKMSKTFT